MMLARILRVSSRLAETIPRALKMPEPIPRDQVDRAPVPEPLKKPEAISRVLEGPAELQEVLKKPEATQGLEEAS